MLFGFSQYTFFLEGANSLSAQLHSNLLAVHLEGLFLQVRLPDLFGPLLRERNIVPELLAFISNVAFLCHGDP